MIFKKRGLIPVKELVRLDYNVDTFVRELAHEIIVSTEIEREVVEILNGMERDDNHGDAYASYGSGKIDYHRCCETKDGERILLSEIDEYEVFDDKDIDDMEIVWIMESEEFITFIQNYININYNKGDYSDGYKAIQNLFNIDPAIARSVMYEVLHKVILVERIENSKDIIGEFFKTN